MDKNESYSQKLKTNFPKILSLLFVVFCVVHYLFLRKIFSPHLILLPVLGLLMMTYNIWLSYQKRYKMPLLMVWLLLNVSAGLLLCYQIFMQSLRFNEVVYIVIAVLILQMLALFKTSITTNR